MNNQYKLVFSIQPHDISFDYNQLPSIKIPQGYQDIINLSRIKSYIDELAIEYLILNIENLIEDFIKQHKDIALVQGAASTQDQYAIEISQYLFQEQQVLQRDEIEFTFNQLISNLYQAQHNLPNPIISITYFVFLREFMHHLDIQTLFIKPSETMITSIN